MKAKVGQRHGV